MNDLQQAIADSIADLAGYQGAWAFGAAKFAGSLAYLTKDDPRMVGSTDRLAELHVTSANLPNPYPRRGDTITCDGLTYTVSRVDHDAVSRTTVFLVSTPNTILS